MTIHYTTIPSYHQPGPCNYQILERLRGKDEASGSFNKRISQTGLSCVGTGTRAPRCSQHYRSLAEDEHLFPCRLQLCSSNRGSQCPGAGIMRPAKVTRARWAGGVAESMRRGSCTHLKDCTSGGSLQLWPRSLCTSLAAALIILSACSSLLCSPRSTCEAKQTRV